MKIIYKPSDRKGKNYRRHIGDAGDFPYTRGIYPNMYAGRPWTIRQFAGFGSAADTNKRFKFLLKEGENGLSVAFDLPTLMGYDSDHPLCEGEVGRCGVAVSSLRDMEALFDGIPLGDVSTSMTINGPAAIIFAMYIALAKKRKIPIRNLRGTIQNDILKEYVAQKEWLFPPEPSMRLIADVMEYCSREMPKWNTISISGYHIREAGSDAAQELAFTLANGFAYVEAGIARGLDVDAFAPRLSFFFGAHSDFFEEIAKFRAARRIWAKHMRYKYKAKDERSWQLRFHTQTAGCTLTRQQPVNNVVRVAYQALSAVLGGTQSLHTDSMDETHCLPSQEAVLVALRTQQILFHETNAKSTADPLGGSYYLENLTDEMEEKAERYFKDIKKLGGVVEAIERGFFQKEISKSAWRYQRALETKKKIVVGVNDYAVEDEINNIPHFYTPKVERGQIRRLKEMQKKRDTEKVKSGLAKLEAACVLKCNLMPILVECVTNYATLGEIADSMRRTLGVYKPREVW